MTSSENAELQQSIELTTKQLEVDRRARSQLMRIGIPAQIGFFIFAFVSTDNEYLFILVVPLVLVLRLLFLRTLAVPKVSDKSVGAFLQSLSVFRNGISARNDVTNDPVRVRQKTRYRHVQWTHAVLVFEQRWKQTDNQFFLIIGPTHHWWSWGSIWLPSTWQVRKNTDLSFSKATMNSNRRFCIRFKFPETPDWTLRFKTETVRDQLHQSLSVMRRLKAAESSDRELRDEQENDARNKGEYARVYDGDKLESLANSRTRDVAAWHELLGVRPDSSMEEITMAYRLAVKKCHPDTVADKSDLIKKVAAEETRSLNEAYRVARTLRRS